MKKSPLYRIYFDMDGTLADLYNVPNWLEQLRAKCADPYLIAKPMCDMKRLQAQLVELQKRNIELVICSWLSIGASPEYAEAIIGAKLQWLNAHLPQVVFDDYLFLEYGECKHHYAKRNTTSILFDDCADIRRKWNRASTRSAFAPSDINRVLSYLTDSII